MSERTRGLFLGDGVFPLTTSGFGTAGRRILGELCQHYSMAHLALAGVELERIKAARARSQLPCLTFPSSPQDLVGCQPGGALDQALCTWDPDFVFIEADPGQVYFHMGRIANYRQGGKRPKVLAHCYIEGEPMMTAWTRLCNDTLGQQLGEPDFTLDSVMVPTQYGASVVKGQTGRVCPVVPVGIDMREWYPYAPEVRDELRARLGWTDKFVCMYVGANVARKQHPRLFAAIKRARELVPNLLCYDHCKPFSGFYLQGWNLMEVAAQIGVADIILFNNLMQVEKGKSHYHGIDGSEQAGTLSLIDFYNCADCLVHLSEVEGFGIPLLEAQACGLPIITVPYAAGWEVCGGAAVGVDIADWDYNSSGTRVARADVGHVAKQIAKLAAKPMLRQDLRERGLANTQRYRWSDALATVQLEVARVLA